MTSVTPDMILGEEIIQRSGSFVRKRRWLRGAHSTLGLITQGWSGVETVQEVDVIVPMVVYKVEEPAPATEGRVPALASAQPVTV